MIASYLLSTAHPHSLVAPRGGEYPPPILIYPVPGLSSESSSILLSLILPGTLDIRGHRFNPKRLYSNLKIGAFSDLYQINIKTADLIGLQFV